MNQVTIYNLQKIIVTNKLGLSCAKLRLRFAKLWLKLISFVKGSLQNISSRKLSSNKLSSNKLSSKKLSSKKLSSNKLSSNKLSSNKMS